MSPIAIVLLVVAAVLVVAAEWSRLAPKVSSTRLSPGGRKARSRKRQKEKLQVVHPDSEEFARSVERDLASLPTIDEHDAKRR